MKQKPDTETEKNSEVDLLSFVHFGMRAFPNPRTNKKMLRIDQPLGIQAELSNRVNPITRSHISLSVSLSLSLSITTQEETQVAYVF